MWERCESEILRVRNKRPTMTYFQPTSFDEGVSKSMVKKYNKGNVILKLSSH